MRVQLAVALAAIGSLLVAPLPVRGQGRRQGQGQNLGRDYIQWNLPRWVDAPLRKAGLGTRFEPFYDLNPYYQRGDFDGDGKTDLAVQIVEKRTRKRGIAIVHAGNLSVHVLGAGTQFAKAGDDFSWLWVWRVEEPEGTRTREALYVEKPESASGLIAWNGRSYIWIPDAD